MSLWEVANLNETKRGEMDEGKNFIPLHHTPLSLHLLVAGDALNGT